MELDKLKEAWGQLDTDDRLRVNKDDIYKMIHSKSSSAVKWIFYFSIIELLIIIITPFIFSSNTDHRLFGLENGKDIFIFLNLIIVIFFSYKFYKSYSSIKVTNSTLMLMSQIKTTRRWVRMYWITSMILATLAIMGYLFDNFKLSEINDLKTILVTIAASILIIFIMLALFLGIFFLVYGILLRKLNKNYTDLKNLKN